MVVYISVTSHTKRVAIRFGLFQAGYERSQWKMCAMMKGMVDAIEKLTERNEQFRQVLCISQNILLVPMARQPGADTGKEIHFDRDQFFRFETGNGEVWIDGVANQVKADCTCLVKSLFRGKATK